jgi:localization factor PodJL
MNPSASDQMSQSLSWSLDELEPDARDIARREARRAGMSVEDWLDVVMRDSDDRGRVAAPAHDDYDDHHDEPAQNGPTHGRFTQSRLNRDEADTLLAKAAASDRRVREAEGRTAQMLESITRWMEKAESRIRASERSASERHERTTSAVAEAIKTVGSRLNEVERRSGSERRAFPELRSAPDRREALQPRGQGSAQGISRANFADAVAAIKARQRDLDGEPRSRRASPPAHAEDRVVQMPRARQNEGARNDGIRNDGAEEFRAMREELRTLSESFSERRAAPRSAASGMGSGSGEDMRSELLRLRREVARGDNRSNSDITGSLSAMIARLDRQASAGGGNDRMTRTLERLEQDVAKLAAGRGQGGEAIERQIARLHQRLDQMGNGADDRGLMQQVNREIGDLSERLGSTLNRSIGALSDEIAAMRKAQQKAQEEAREEAKAESPQIAELRSAIEQMRGTPADAAQQSALLAHIDAISRKIDQTQQLSAEDLESRLGQMMERLAESRADDGAMASRIEALSGKLDTLTLGAPESLERRLDALQAMIQAAPAPASASPVLERQIEQLAARLENLAASNGLVQVLAKDGKPAYADLRPLEGSLRKIEERITGFEKADPSDKIEALADRVLLLSERIESGAAVAPRDMQADLAPLEAMIRSLQERLEQAQESDGSSGAMQALESQIAQLGRRIEERPAPAADPAVDSTLRELFSAVEALRNDGLAATERGVRSAMATGIDELKATQGALENRLTSQFGGIHEQMERIAERLATLNAPQKMDEARMPALPEAMRFAMADDAPTQAGPQMQAEPQMRAEAPMRAEAAVRVEAPVRVEPPRKGAPAMRMEPKVSAEPVLELKDADAPAARKAAARPAPPDMPSLIDQPLEPGSGRPRKDEAQELPPAIRPDSGDPQAIKANYIAAARRAVQAAAAEAQAASVDERKAKGGKAGKDAGKAAPGKDPSSKAGAVANARALVEKRKKPILLGLAAAIVALGSLQVISTALLKGPDISGPARISTAQPEKPAVERPAEKTTDKAADKAAEKAGAPRIVEAAKAPAADPKSLTAGPAQPQIQPAPGQISLPPVSSGLQSPAAEAPPAAGASIGPSAAIAAAPVASAPLAPPALVTGLPELPATLGPAGLRKAAGNGDARAVFDLATRLADGRGVQRDPKLSIKLFERAAAAGLVPAQFRVGNMYEKGIGANRDIGLARMWYERAAEKGNAKAMHNLAVLYAEGATGKPDYPMAGEWFRKAAEHGVRDSQFNLAILLARGLGAAQDLGQSYTWFAIAAAQGDEEAGKKRDEVALQLPPAELAAAKAAIERWKARPLEPAANEVSLPAKGWDEPVAQPAPPKKMPKNTQA